MPSVTTFSEAFAMAIHSMVLLATTPEDIHNTHSIAERLEASEHHLQKVHQRLRKSGLIESIRGPGGGVRLARSPESVTFLEIFEVIEGPLETRTCLFDKPICGEEFCIVRGLFSRLDEQARSFLANVTLAEFVEKGHQPPD